MVRFSIPKVKERAYNLNLHYLCNYTPEQFATDCLIFVREELRRKISLPVCTKNGKFKSGVKLALSGLSFKRIAWHKVEFLPYNSLPACS
jgi:hypothetical protein